MFPLGSKLTHTCGQPNTCYKSYHGRGYHVAVRDIAAGELLTTCYLGWGRRLGSTLARWVRCMHACSLSHCPG
jgi:hypothetical protein